MRSLAAGREGLLGVKLPQDVAEYYQATVQPTLDVARVAAQPRLGNVGIASSVSAQIHISGIAVPAGVTVTDLRCLWRQSQSGIAGNLIIAIGPYDLTAHPWPGMLANEQPVLPQRSPCRVAGENFTNPSSFGEYSQTGLLAQAQGASFELFSLPGPIRADSIYPSGFSIVIEASAMGSTALSNTQFQWGEVVA